MRFSRLKRVGALIAILSLAACVTPPKPLYYWNAFPKLQYSALLKEDGDRDVQIRQMEQDAQNAQSLAQPLPPGFRAHLGMLYLNSGDIDKARAMWEQEIEAFPESAPYMQKLLSHLKEVPGHTSSYGSGAS